MPMVRRTPRAHDDLAQIVDYIAADNLSAAVSWLERMETLFHLLAAQPEIGEQRRSKQFKRLRRHVSQNYVIYYLPVTDGVQILRVLHAARDDEELI
jgi:toxin ParE1/3/4